MSNWYNLSAEQAAAELKTDWLNGLAGAEVAERLREFGPNQLRERKLTPAWKIFFDQFKDIMIIVLLLAALVSGLIGEVKDTVMILIIVIINALLGTTQQARAEKAIAALKKLTGPQAMVVRAGQIVKIDSSELAPGDLILLEAGNYIPADIRLLKSVNLKVDESALTGESVPVEKTDEPLAGANVLVNDQTNMAFAGTIVVYGRARGIVVETGMRTEVGKIARLIESSEAEETPLQKRFAELGKWLAGIALSICFIVFLAGVLEGDNVFEMLLTSISLAVAAIPEGLPAVITISLALGAYRMAKKKAVIRKLPAVETLGSTTVICSDKTGTLTQNKMKVQSVNPFRENERGLLLKAGALCNDATSEIGDPTETALVSAAEDAGFSKKELENDYPRHQEIPFDSTRKMMTTLHRLTDGSYVAFAKGALEIIIERTVLGPAEKERVLAESRQYEAGGQRVLGLAYKKDQHRPQELTETELEFLGYVAMSDPPRPEAFEAVKLCRQAGIRPIMITGDHKLTALAIAIELGIAKSDSEVLTGRELEAMSVPELKEKVKAINVFARVSPEHKLRIIEALKSRGEIVAMTGDGVNDAPALKKADIGIAMGESGTDVARAAADMVLTDDNFATIVAAVEEGRGIYDNIKKFIRYMLSTNSGEIFTMFFSIVLRWPLPLLPIHILWVNLVTDGLPAVALSAEPIEKGIMQKPPRDPNESIFAGGLLMSMLGIGTLMAVGTLCLFSLNLNGTGIDKARTVAFTTLSLLQMAHVLNCRSLDKSIFKLGLFSNVYLALAVGSTIVLQVLVVYVPFLQFAFRTVPLEAIDWLLIAVVSLTPIFFVEARKLITARYRP
ncbi:MAG: cation-translocating P-type ATPase [Candidatus Margulisbacteria bacterium]|nr:cation-translocating P-type ATPase [Candidatus Margulisiibacteriota bacterium]